MEKGNTVYTNQKLSPDDYNYLQELDENYLNEYIYNDEATHFTEEDYKILQEQLILYKEGNREACEYIVRAFHRLLHSYTRFIVLKETPTREYYDKKNNCTRKKIDPNILKFIGLFGKKKKDQARLDYIRDTSDYIHNLFKTYEYGDIYNELVLALLNMANKYKVITDENDPKYKRNGTFHMYVKKCFHFEAWNFLTKLAKDPLVFNRYNIIDINDDDFDEEYRNHNTILVDRKATEQFSLMIDYIDRQIEMRNSSKVILKEDVDLLDDDSLNFNWINGAVNNPAFKKLTSYERELLILLYVKNQTEETVAKLLGYSQQGIDLHKKKAVKKLKEALEIQEKGD